MNPLEKFGHKVCNTLVENFPQTFFVGGVVRDGYLNRKITDIDLATTATPGQVAELLRQKGIMCDTSHSKFGVVVAKQGNLNVEVATFRKETYGHSRYPQISYITNAKLDAKRRDFTVNALYLQGITYRLLDYFGGKKDLKDKTIRFIGDPKKRIQEDPLRIIRALRFCIILGFKLEIKTKQAVKNNFYLVKTLTHTRLEKEILKLKNKKQKIILQKVINSPILLDKYFK